MMKNLANDTGHLAGPEIIFDSESEYYDNNISIILCTFNFVDIC
jgi:hypothetical protein